LGHLGDGADVGSDPDPVAGADVPVAAPGRLDDGWRGPVDQQRLPRPDREGHHLVDGLARGRGAVGRVEADAAAVLGRVILGYAGLASSDVDDGVGIVWAVQPHRVTELGTRHVLDGDRTGADEAALAFLVRRPRVAVGVAPTVDSEQFGQALDEAVETVGDPFHRLVAAVPCDDQAGAFELPRHSGCGLCDHHDLGV